MSSLPESSTCPKCGGPIPAEAPQGLCPKCLLFQASSPTEDGQGAIPKSPAPSLVELAAAFPQLEILELIGQGGMGFVFKARQPKIERLVALKILPQSLAADPAFAERFTREGRVLARLNHPNIVTLHDFGQANGFFYLLMEFVDGVNLRQAMRAGRFTPSQALAVVPKICEALQFAHNEGILHRDIKPENILLDAKGRVKIADFGIAKLVSTEADRAGSPFPAASKPNDIGATPPAETALTDAGKVLGTPNYMAPEQLEKPGAVDHRADIYSLGVVFYEMLTGELPIGKFQPPSEKVQVDVRLDEVVLHALEKEPARRYQQVSEVKTAVDTIASAPPPRSPEPAAQPAPEPDRFWRRFAIVGALGVLAMILIPVAAILLAIILPAYQKARAHATAVRQQIEASSTPVPDPPAYQKAWKLATDSRQQPEAVSTETPPPPVSTSNGEPTRFEFRWVARDDETNLPADLMPDPSDRAGQTKLRVLPEVLLDSDAVASAGFTSYQPEQKEILVVLTAQGGRTFTKLTGSNIGRRLAIVWNGRVLSAPRIAGPITGRDVKITGIMSAAESQLLLDVLNHRAAKPPSGVATGISGAAERNQGKLILLTGATNTWLDAAKNLHSVFVKTDSLMLPGESLVQLTRQPDGQIIESRPGFFIRRNPDPKTIRTSSLFNWVFQGAFGNDEVNSAVAQLAKNRTELPVTLVPDEPLELFSVTNKFGASLAGLIELKRSVPGPFDGSNATIQASVQIHSYGEWPSIQYSADVPPGYELQATANMGEIHTTFGPGSTDTVNVMWIPRSPFAISGTPEQMMALRVAQRAQLQRLVKQGPIQVALGQPYLLFSVTNSSREVFQGSFELAGPPARTIR